MRSIVKIALAVLVVAAWTPASASFAEPIASPRPPDEPIVRPTISHPGRTDADHSRLDDRLENRLRNTKAALAAERNASRRASLRAALDERTTVELVFLQQITQRQIDDFLALGGQIDHIYQAVSYGWNGTIPLRLIEGLPQLMGESLVAVVGDTVIEKCLDEATRCGRARPVWAAGFAGGAGYSGNNSTTIAIMDSGIDDTHPDFSGRQQYWKDYSTDRFNNPADGDGHGSHVGGIAFGSGAAGGTGNQLLWTDSGNMSGITQEAYYPSPVHIPDGLTATWTEVAGWIGGSSTKLVAYRAPNGSNSYTTLSLSTTGYSPITEINTFTAGASYHYTPALLQTPSQPISSYYILNSVTYAPIGDGFNTFRGLAPGCRWAGAKIFTNSGGSFGTWISNACDDLLNRRSQHNIKVVNMSFHVYDNNGIDETLRNKINTMVDNGMIIVCSAGNYGSQSSPNNEVDDPGRAAKAITVAASNDINQLTYYSSVGFSSPAANEDYKPDLMAPGGSALHSYIMSVDTNDADGGFSDQRANDYANYSGTSMAAPFVSGAAALVIQALEETGITWSFTGNTHPLLVKMLLCATATESNTTRESGGSSPSPTLGRAATPKDLYEGYGMINVDAAIEAVKLNYTAGMVTDSTAGGSFDRRAWGRKVSLTNGTPVTLWLDAPSTGDFDIYVYAGTSDSKGNPVIRASSSLAGNGVDETISFTPSVTETGYLVIKRASGNGTWTLAGSTIADGTAPGIPTVTDDGAFTSSGTQIHAGWTATDAQTGIAEYQYAISATKLESGIISGGGWQSAGMATQATRSGLSLSYGQVYYVLVKAKNGVGTWGAIGTSDGILRVQYSPLKICGTKTYANSATVGVSSATVKAIFTGYFYAQDNSGGIRVYATETPAGFAVGKVIDIGGTMQTSTDERNISSAQVKLVGDGDNKPVDLIGKAIGGADWKIGAGGAGQVGITGAVGLNNIGSLVRLCGKIDHVDSGYLYLDDGSGILDGTTTSGQPNKGVRILCNSAGFSAGQYAVATGISAFFLNGGNRCRAIQVRAQPADLARLK